MKKILLTLAFMAAAVVAHAQGTVNFNNFVSGEVNARVSLQSSGAFLAGTQYGIQLYSGISGSSALTLTANGAVLNFRTASGAGYLNPNGTDTTRVIAGVTPGSAATIQVRAWDLTTGSTWETATIRGESNLLTLNTGGAGNPPGLPANLVGLQAFSIAPIPEPSTFALGALGVGALLMVRRRKV